MLHKIDSNKKCARKLIFSNEFFFQKDSDDFWHWKSTLKIRFWHFLTSIFGHLTSLMKKSMPFLWSVQLWLQSEMFLSNSIDLMKKLPKGIQSSYLSTLEVQEKQFFYTYWIFYHFQADNANSAKSICAQLFTLWVFEDIINALQSATRPWG